MNNFLVEICPKYFIIHCLSEIKLQLGILPSFSGDLCTGLQVIPETHEVQSPLEIFAFALLSASNPLLPDIHMAPFQNSGFCLSRTSS